MAVVDVDASSIAQAIAECQRLGRDKFVDTYGFGRATRYLLRVDGHFYDPKAIVGVAHQYTGNGGSPLSANEFDATDAIQRLRRLAYEVVSFRRLWWVNQGSSYVRSSQGGYLWAPTLNKNGQQLVHWSAMTQVKTGDMIIHYANSYIRAIGAAVTEAQASPRPDPEADAQWGEEGRLVRVAYAPLAAPIPISDVPNRAIDVGPFDKNGDVKQGYLFPINEPYVLPLLEFLNARIPDLFNPSNVIQPMELAATQTLSNSAPPDPVMDALLAFHNVILEGVPGTGKSFRIRELSEFWRLRTGRPLHRFGDKLFAAMVMHPSTAYEDFVEGLRPAMRRDGGPVLFDTAPQSEAGHFTVQDGFFVDVCRVAVQHPHHDVLVLLDELNRCNVPSVLGDLLLTLETSQRAIYQPDPEQSATPTAAQWTAPVNVILPYSRRQFFIPNNVYVVATANTTDRSIAPVDAALRRRFAFHRLDPEPPNFAVSTITTDPFTQELLSRSITVLDTLNRDTLAACLGPDATLGHSYLYHLAADLRATLDAGPTTVARHWRYAILPQLVDGVRTLGAEDLLSPTARADWFTNHTSLAGQSGLGTDALTALDRLLTDLGLRITVEGVGLSRGTRIIAAAIPSWPKSSSEDIAAPGGNRSDPTDVDQDSATAMQSGSLDDHTTGQPMEESPDPSPFDTALDPGATPSI